MRISIPALLSPAFLAAVIAIISGATASAQDSTEAESVARDRFNVLLIISDDLRTELGCYGVERARTPHIDALAERGALFQRAYCQFPLCNPSRSSMLTGRYPATTGVYGNRDWYGARHPEWRSLPRWFKEHGYTTARAGKIFHGGIDEAAAWTVGGEERRFGAVGAASPAQTAFAQQARPGRPGTGRRGPAGGTNQPLTKAQRSDRWLVLDGEGERNGDYRNTTRAIEYLQQYKDQPFFIALGLSKPHSPMEAPQSCYELYPLESIELPPDFAERPTVPPGFPGGSIRPRNADLFIGRDATPELAREMIRAYLATVTFVDRNVGRVMAEFDRLGLSENTVVVFWGDHGYQLGEKGKWSKAGSLWEQGCRTPLIIYAPGAAGDGRSSPRVVELIDLYPTLIELCGLPAPAGLEGRSLAPLLDDPDAAWDHPAYTIWSEDGVGPTGIAVRTKRWRYAEFADGGAMLLDEAADPHEMTNLADDPEYADVRARLSALVGEHRARHAPGGDAP